MAKPPLIVFSKTDYKSSMWSEIMTEQGVQAIGTNGYIARTFIHLLKGRKIEAFIFRYVNDRKSFVKSVLFLLSDLSVCCIAYLFGIKRLWISHNIDKESQSFFPRMVRFRRKLLAKCAYRIFVTDPLLIPHGKKHFASQAGKIDFVTFGEYKVGLIQKVPASGNQVSDLERNYYRGFDFDQLIELLREVREPYEFVGFCGGKFSKKRVNFRKIPDLMQQAKTQGARLLLVVISDIKESDNPVVFQELQNNPDIVFINNQMSLDEKQLSDWIDFYWSGYDDISVPYTTYTATTVEVPLLSTASGILPELIRNYQIGHVIEEDLSNLHELLQQMKNRDHYRFKDFLDSHSWEIGASKLLEGIRGSK